MHSAANPAFCIRSFESNPHSNRFEMFAKNILHKKSKSLPEIARQTATLIPHNGDSYAAVTKNDNKHLKKEAFV